MTHKVTKPIADFKVFEGDVFELADNGGIPKSTTVDTTIDDGHVREHVCEHVCEQVERIVAVCVREMSERELRETIGVKNRPNFTTRYLARALAGGYLERTSVGTRSPLQKYRLTDKGRFLAAQLAKKPKAIK